MNGFEKHGIDHLSASSINLWTNAPDVWVAKYLKGVDLPYGPAAERGKAVEQGVLHVLQGVPLTIATADAHAAYDKCFPIGTEKTTKERDVIAPMIEQAVQALEQYGEPEFETLNGQDKIELVANCGAFKIPIWGYLDFVFPKDGLVVDLKTTKAVPSVMTTEHQLQRCFYAKAKGNMAVKFLYASPKKFAWREDGDVAQTLALAKKQIMRMETFLQRHDADAAVACIPVKASSFYWANAHEQRVNLYGF